MSSELGQRLRVGEIATRRIGILHPEEPPLADHEVGVLVEAEERGNRPHPFLDVATEHDPTVAGDVAGEQQVRVVEIPGEEGSRRDPADGDPAGAVIGRVDVVCPLRIVELRGAPLDDDVGVGLFAEVDARFVDRRASGRDRRNVLEVEDRQPFGALAGDRAHHRPIAVREQHVAVDPGLGIGRQQRGLELAGRQASRSDTRHRAGSDPHPRSWNL